MAIRRTDQHILEHDPQLKRHLAQLGLETLREYRQWCADNGFCRKLDKNDRQRRQEAEHAQRKTAVATMVRKRRERRRPPHPLRDLCRQNCWDDCWSPAVQAFYRLSRHTRIDGRDLKPDLGTLETLIAHLIKCKVRLLDGDPYYPALGLRPGNTALEALPLIVAYHRYWVRPLRNWKPTCRTPHQQFRSLLNHLFVRYGELPPFLEQVWLAGTGERQADMRRLYLFLAAGNSLAHYRAMPIAYTKKMAHHFIQAPRTISVEQAIRWGEVKGMGGDDDLAHAVVQSRLAIDFQNYKFWNVVLQWLIRHPEVDRARVGAIIDYLHFQRFEPQYLLTGEGQPETGAPREPNLTMRGRTPESLLRQVDLWQRTPQERFVYRLNDWTPCGVAGYELLEEDAHGELVNWTIRELLSSRAIVQEGAAMGHCVAQYIGDCQNGDASIWSLQRETATHKSRALTIELCPNSRYLVQFSGCHNRSPTEDEIRIVSNWTRAAKLQVLE